MPAKLTLTVKTDRLSGLPQRARDLLSAVVSTAAHQVEAHAKQAIMDGPKTGRIYEKGEQEVSFTTKDGKQVAFTARKGKKSRTHQASAPGEAPATDEGLLVNSIQTTLHGPHAAEVNVGAEYGETLERGSLDGRLAPRPFLAPAVEAVRPGFEAAVRVAIERATQ
jgi:hypothetical protein